jgi:hypothetical protein
LGVDSVMCLAPPRRDRVIHPAPLRLGADVEVVGQLGRRTCGCGLISRIERPRDLHPDILHVQRRRPISLTAKCALQIAVERLQFASEERSRIV